MGDRFAPGTRRRGSRNLHLTQHKALACREGRDRVDGRVAALLAAGPPRGLAIDGDAPLRHAGLRGDPGNEAALELLGVEHREDVAEMVVCRRATLERTEAPQKLELLSAEQGDIGDRLGTGQHGEQTRRQDLVQRVGHLALLAGPFRSLK